MKINISALSAELIESVKECAEMLGLETGTDGYALKTETAEGLTVRFDGKDFTVGYPENARHLFFRGLRLIKQNGDKAQREASNQLNSNIGASDGTQNVVSLDNGTYYRLTVQDLSKQHIDRSGLDKAGSSVWRRSWLWCMGVVLVAYCLVALPRIRRQGLEEA